jgi:hypothetical protein
VSVVELELVSVEVELMLVSVELTLVSLELVSVELTLVSDALAPSSSPRTGGEQASSTSDDSSTPRVMVAGSLARAPPPWRASLRGRVDTTRHDLPACVRTPPLAILPR